MKSFDDESICEQPGSSSVTNVLLAIFVFNMTMVFLLLKKQNIKTVFSQLKTAIEPGPNSVSIAQNLATMPNKPAVLSRIWYVELKILSSILQSIKNHYSVWHDVITYDFLMLYQAGVTLLQAHQTIYKQNQVHLAAPTKEQPDLRQLVIQCATLRKDILSVLHQGLSKLQDQSAKNALLSLQNSCNEITFDLIEGKTFSDARRKQFESKVDSGFGEIIPGYLNKISICGRKSSAAQNLTFEQAMSVCQAKKELPQRYGQAFTNLFRQQQQLLFLSHWRRVLDEISPIESPSLFDAIKVQSLLHGTKAQYFLQFFQNPAQTNTATWLALAPFSHVDITVTEAKQKLQAQVKQKFQSILAKELALKTYSWPQAVAGFVVRLAQGSHYYKMGSNFMEGGDEVTLAKPLAGVPIVRVPLWPSYMRAFSTLGGGLFFAIDYYAARHYLGMTFPMLHMFRRVLTQEILVPKLLSCMPADARLAQAYAPTEWLMGLGVHVGVYNSYLGFNMANTLMLSASYSSATGAHMASGELLKVLSKRSTYNLSEEWPRLFALTKGVIESGAYVAGHKFYFQLHPHLRDWFIPPDANTLLKNTKLCLSWYKQCEQEARKVLNIRTGGIDDVRKQWRLYAKANHPDKTPGMAAEYYRGAAAKESMERLHVNGLLKQ